MRIIVFILLAAATLFTTPAAVTLSLSHPSLPHDTNTALVHTITGLATGEKVLVERIADFNGNGAIDPGEPSLRTFSVTDGVRPVIGGIVNGNVPGDDDAAANGAIRIDLNYPGVDVILGRQTGRYIVRVTGASGSHTRLFEITAPSLPQRVSGVVRNTSNAVPIPNATVVVLVGDGFPLGSVRADANGAYSFVAPPGDYVLLPAADGLLGAFTPINLAAGQTTTEDLSMEPATVRITGRVVDSATQAGLPTIFVIAENESGEITGALTDSSGNYALSVLPGEWGIYALFEFAAQTGHLTSEDEFITATSSPLTVNFSLVPVNALVHGRITDVSGAPIAGLLMEAEGQNPLISSTEFESSGRTTANGDYWIGLSGGSNSQWRYGAGEDSNATYLAAQFDLSPAAGQAVLSNFSLSPPTAQITGLVRTSSNVPLADIGVHASATINNVHYSADARTDSSGRYSFPAINGSWNISVNCNDLQPMNYSCPQGTNIAVNNNNPTHDFIVSSFVSTATLSGRVIDSTGAGLSDVHVVAFTQNSIFRTANSSPDGSFSIPVNAGTWYLQVSGDAPAGLLGPTLEFNVTDGNNINNIQLRLIPADVTLSGTLKNSSGVALAGIRLYINGTVNNTNYSLPQVTTTESGSFSVQVARGSWHISPDCSQLTSLGYLCSFLNAIDTTGGNVTENIVVSRPVTSPNLLSPRLVNTGGTSTFEFTITGGPATYEIHGAPSVPFTNGSWRLLDTRIIPAGQTSVIVTIDPQENRFFRVQAR